jgi:predicted nucleic acid-binding protein
VSALIDTSLMLDYLKGDRRAGHALEPYGHCAISAITWLEVMALSPPELLERTRGFLRSFERLSVSEAVADEALRLMHGHAGLPFHRALTWATARVNQLPYVTVDTSCIAKDERNVVVPYRWKGGARNGGRELPADTSSPWSSPP